MHRLQPAATCWRETGTAIVCPRSAQRRGAGQASRPLSVQGLAAGPRSIIYEPMGLPGIGGQARCAASPRPRANANFDVQWHACGPGSLPDHWQLHRVILSLQPGLAAMQGAYLQTFAEQPAAPFYSIPIQAPAGFYYAPAPAAAPLPATGAQGRGREPPLQLPRWGRPAPAAALQATTPTHCAGPTGGGGDLLAGSGGGAPVGCRALLSAPPPPRLPPRCR